MGRIWQRLQKWKERVLPKNKCMIKFSQLEELEYIPRDEIETIYSLTHYDGPRTGLVKWNDKHYFTIVLDEVYPRRYYLIDTPQEYVECILKWCHEWIKYMNSAIVWKSDGTHPLIDNSHRPLRDSLEAVKWRKDNKNPAYFLDFNDCDVVGYFIGWHIGFVD